MKDIGSIFSINEDSYANCTGVNSFFENKDLVFYSLCREALVAIAEENRDSNRNVLLPAYTCSSLISPFLQSGWEVSWYDIKKDLRIDTEDLISKCMEENPSLCLFHPYFGYDFNEEERKAIHTIKQQGITLVNDLTQCLFSNQRSDDFDYYIASIRKWFPIPDGAILFDRNHRITADQLETYDTYASLQLEAMILRERYFNTLDEDIKQRSIQLNKKANEIADGKIKKHRMSEYSYSHLPLMCTDDYMRRRTENYEYLYENINQCDCVLGRVTDCCCDVTSAPLYYPVYLKEPTYVQKQMARQHIYLPLLWRGNAGFAEKSKNATFIYDHIAVIPCDQRYSITDMDRIIDSLRGV